jgi:Dullard-like phosphatase family protein
MFYFLTKKDIKNNDIKLNSENKKDNKSEKFKKNLLKNRDITPLKNGTYTSINKLIDSNYNESDKNQNINNQSSKSKEIKNNLTNSIKTNKINNNNHPLMTEKSLDEANTSFYTKLKYYFNLYLSNFLLLLEKNKVKPPFLPKLDTNKYKYTLVLDLDETLVHYIEEENSAYVQVRPYADYFLKELSKYFEIVLFTAAEEDYTDIVLKELNKNNYISHVLCRKYTELNNNSYIKDLSKLGRDLSKVCIVDNNKDNFCLQPENGLFISSYYGEQNDNELYLLCGDLMKIIEIQPDDIRPVIKEIDIIMQRRYSENMYVIQ